MVIKEITDKSLWENFISSQNQDSFLQSWNWGQFNSAMGDKIWRIGIFEGDELVAVALLVKVSAKRGSFIFCPHGPVIGQSSKIENKRLLAEFFDFVKQLALKEKMDFIRISPLLENTAENLKIFKDAGFKDAPIHMMHPEISWILDISKSEEEVLKGMRKTTRNLVRRAERDGVVIEEGKNKDAVEKFYAIHEETVSRHNFVPFPKKYLEKEFEVFSPDDQISVFSASHEGKVLSSAIIVFHGQSAFYHHGASLASKVPASYLLLWAAIREAKKRKIKLFNFWGIAPEDKPKHPWAGLSLFKIGFGGCKREYLHCQDLSITKKYCLTWAVESYRKWKKGY